jgi:hypothetical protein
VDIPGSTSSGPTTAPVSRTSASDPGLARAHQQVRGRSGAQHRPGLAGHPQRPVGEPGAGERADGERDGGGGPAGSQRRHQFLGGGQVRAPGQRQRGERGRQDRPGYQRVGELFERGRQVDHVAARAAQVLRYRDGEDPEVADVRPVCPPKVTARFHGPHGAQDVGPARPGADRGLEGQLLGGAGDGHPKIRTRFT